MVLLALIFTFVCASQAFILDDFIKQEKWDGLKVTWGPNPLSSQYFDSVPRTVSEAQKDGWHKISDCDKTASWRGQRWIKGNDYAVILLFDVNGFIAGIQTSFADNQSNGFPKAQLRPPFVKDGDRVTFSAYFVDPSIICTTGRTAAQFAEQGTGTNLYLQTTADPEASVMQPHQQTGISATQWTEGKCFPTMGKHYWYNLSENMNCDDFYPAFLLYNSGELTAFGFALGANLNSPRYEHPGSSQYSLFMKTPPKCLYNQGQLSTMHIYLTSSAALDLC